MLASVRTLFGSSKELLFPNSSSTLLNNGVCSKACKLSLLVLKSVAGNSKQNKSLLPQTPYSERSGGLTEWAVNKVQKLSFQALASNSHRGLSQRLSQRCLPLIIPRIKQASATHKIKLPKLGKIKKHQKLQATQKTTQINSKQLKAQTATGLPAKGVNFSIVRRWARSVDLGPAN